jgi:hypothetical protein
MPDDQCILRGTAVPRCIRSLPGRQGRPHTNRWRPPRATPRTVLAPAPCTRRRRTRHSGSGRHTPRSCSGRHPAGPGIVCHRGSAPHRMHTYIADSAHHPGPTARTPCCNTDRHACSARPRRRRRSVAVRSRRWRPSAPPPRRSFRRSRRAAPPVDWSLPPAPASLDRIAYRPSVSSSGDVCPPNTWGAANPDRLLPNLPGCPAFCGPFLDHIPATGATIRVSHNPRPPERSRRAQPGAPTRFRNRIAPRRSVAALHETGQVAPTGLVAHAQVETGPRKIRSGRRSHPCS